MSRVVSRDFCFGSSTFLLSGLSFCPPPPRPGLPRAFPTASPTRARTLSRYRALSLRQAPCRPRPPVSHGLQRSRLRGHPARPSHQGRDGDIASALLVARMVHPASERETNCWLRCHSATAELVSLEGDRKALYRIGNLLWRCRADIQRELFSRECSLLDIPKIIAFSI